MIGRSIAAAVVVFLLSGVVSLLKSEVYTETLEFTEHFEEGKVLYLESLSGSVKIEGVTGDEVNIKAMKRAKGGEDEAKEALEELKVEVKKDRQRLSVVAEFPRKGGILSGIFGDDREQRNVWVDFEISLPSHFKVSVDVTSADVEIYHVDGGVSLDLTSGDVIGEDIGGRVVVDGTSGRVELRGVKGDVVIDNTSGEAVVIGCSGHVEVDKTSGKVVLRDIKGDVEVDGTSCDVKGEGIEGYITLDLISGDVDLKAIGEGIIFDDISGDLQASFVSAPSRESQLSSVSGDIMLLIKDVGDLDLDLESVSGELSIELEGLQIREISRSSLRAFTGDGNVKVSIETVSGDIDIVENGI